MYNALDDWGPTVNVCSTFRNAQGEGSRVVVSTVAFHARVRGSVPSLGGLKEKNVFPHPRVKVSIVGCLRDREVACSTSDCQCSNFDPVSGGQCHLNHLTILRRFFWPMQFSLYVHKVA